MLPKPLVEKFLADLKEPIKKDMQKAANEAVVEVVEKLNERLAAVQLLQGQLQVAIKALEEEHEKLQC